MQWRVLRRASALPILRGGDRGIYRIPKMMNSPLAPLSRWTRALLILLVAATAGPAFADEDAETCRKTVAELRVRAAALPADDLSRRFAERDLDSALLELAAGDGEDCEMAAARAEHAIENRPYVLRAGEVLKGYGPDGPVLAGPAAAPR